MRRKTLLARSCSLRERAARATASRSDPGDLRPIRSAFGSYVRNAPIHWLAASLGERRVGSAKRFGAEESVVG